MARELTADEWWATLPPVRKAQIMRWLTDPDRREPAPAQEPLPLGDPWAGRR